MHRTPGDGGHYRIRIEGRLDARWATWFEGFTVTVDADGTSVVDGPVTDQAALHGVLHKVRDVGLPLVSVTRTRPGLSPDPAPPRSSPPRPASTRSAPSSLAPPR